MFWVDSVLSEENMFEEVKHEFEKKSWVCFWIFHYDVLKYPAI